MKNNVDKQYIDFLKHILEKGVTKSDRTGTGTISVFDYSMRFDMSEGFPLLTSKKIFTKAVIHELIWFLRGDTNIKYLVDNGVNIWNGDAFANYLKNRSKFANKDNVKEDTSLNNGIKGSSIRPYTQEEFINKIKSDDDFAKRWGNLGPVYGKQWRNWGGLKKVPSGWHHGAITDYKEVQVGDQISDLITQLKTNPDSRRLMVSAWNVDELDKMVLPPCHYGFQCYTRELSFGERNEIQRNTNDYMSMYTNEEMDKNGIPTRKLSLKWSQRSCDSFLGIPFNIASYGLLLHLLAREVNMIPDELIFSGGDCHIYLNHIEAVEKQLESETFKLPKLELKNTSIFNLKFEDFNILEYNSSPTIKAELSN